MIERAGQGCAIGSALFERIHQPYIREGQRTGALRFGDPRAMALTGALAVFVHAVAGFTNKSLRGLVEAMKLPILALSWRVSRHGQAGGHARRTSRVRGLPELGGELPAALLADEIETPGPGQIWVAPATPTQLDPHPPRLVRRLELRDRSINPRGEPQPVLPGAHPPDDRLNVNAF